MKNHSVEVSFNEAETPKTVVELKISPYGPSCKETYAELSTKYADLAKDVGADKVKVFGDLRIKLNKDAGETAAKFAAHYNSVYELIKKMDAEALKSFQNVKFHAEGNILVVGIVAFIPARACEEYNVKKIPTEIAKLLSETNQHATTRVELGASVHDIMYSESSLIEQLYKGIKVSQKISLIQNIKKIISNELKKEDAKNKEIMMCILPVLALELGANVTLKFDDIEELKEHPMMQTFLVNFGQLIESAIGQETDDILADRCDLSTYSEEQKQDD